MNKARSYDDFISQLFEPTKHGKEKSIATITIQVTDACNLACTYCYQINKHTHKIPIEKGKKFIDDILDGKYNNYLDYSQVEAVVLEFIGGEPFLAIDLVAEFTDYFIEGLIKRDHHWKNRYRISICSNGTLYFEPKVQEYLKKHRNHLSFSISVDGNKELHDSCRIFPDGSGSYDKAIAGVKHYREYFDGYMGSKMTIAPGNIQYVTDAVKCFIENGYKEINLNCVYEEGWTVEHAKILYEQLKGVADYLLENDLYQDVYLSIFDSSFFRPKYPEDNNNWCGGDGSMLAVDWRGDLYPCIRYMESSLGTSQKPLKIGNVDTGILATQEECDINQCLKCVTRRSQSTDECFNCPIADGCSWCFPAGTKVSTPDGLVNIEELSAGDIVIDMNGQPQKIYQNLVREANDLVYVKATGLDDLLTTREHPFFCKPVDKRIRNLPVYGDPQWVKAGDLKTSDKIALFVPQLGDIDVDKDVAYILGRYIGDGWKTPSVRKTHPYKYYICTSFDECEDFEKHLISGNIKFKKTMNRTVAEYNIHLTGNDELIQLMDSCGRYAKDKHVPAIVWSWNHESVEALLHGYFDADGSIDNDKDTVRFTSISKTLILNIAELVRAVYKKNVNITERHPSLTTQIEGRVVNQNISYEGRYLTRDPDRKYYEYDDELGVMWVNVASTTKDVPSSATVYNLSVENNPTFIANGAIVHNCSAYNYQCFGTVHQRATYICIMHKARALANAYYWNKVYRISDPNKRFKIWIPEEWALEIIDEDEWKFLKWLESPAQI